MNASGLVSKLQRLAQTMRFRMIAIAVVVHLSIWFVAAFFSSFTAINVIFDSVDRELSNQAMVIGFESSRTFTILDTFDLKLDSSAVQARILSVANETPWEGIPALYWTLDGKPLHQTRNAPNLPMPAEEGFYDAEVTQNGNLEAWRALAKKVDGLYWFVVATDTKDARQAAIQVGIKALYPMVLIIPLTIIGIYLSTAHGLKPMADLASAVASRSPSSLEPVSIEGIHDELKPVVLELNQLLLRLGRALENEHRFTAHAAHELQTPLTAIKAELQLRERQVSDKETRQMLGGIGSRVNRAVHTVKQLLTLARLESMDLKLEFEALDLHQLLAEGLAEYADLAIERNLRIEFPDDQVWTVQGQQESLEILIGNLLLNAFRFGTEEGRVQIDFVRRGEHHCLVVSNDCQAMNDFQRKQLVERFYRQPGTSSPGAGLGLSIVQRIADVHNAELTIDTWQATAGISVTVAFNSIS